VNRHSIEAAAQRLAVARTQGKLIKGLEGLSPLTVEEAHAIQDATVRILGEQVAGWKANWMDKGVSRAPLLSSRVLQGPATFDSQAASDSISVEGEIAFRFLRDLPSRLRPYTRTELESVVQPVVVIELLGSRFEHGADVSSMDRMADCMSNEWLIHGSGQAATDSKALASSLVSLYVNGQELVHQTGGHPVGDPLLPALAFVNAARERDGVSKGCLVTTGSCTDLTVVQPGSHVTVRFAGVGEVSMQWGKARTAL
jgi:2-keto-4-pentenoate hydratase